MAKTSPGASPSPIHSQTLHNGLEGSSAACLLPSSSDGQIVEEHCSCCPGIDVLHSGLNRHRYLARIELSDKVVDSLTRLRSTLLHELCHVAAWVVDHTAKPPHGPCFKHWADR